MIKNSYSLILLLTIFTFIGCVKKEPVTILEFIEKTPSQKDFVQKKNYYILKNKIKVDLKVEGKGLLDLSMYYQKDPENKDQLMIAVHPMQKLLINPDLKKFLGGSQAQQIQLPDEATPQKTGQKTSVAGVSCELLENSLDGKIVFKGCLAKTQDLKLSFGQGKLMSRLMAHLAEVIGQNYGTFDGILIQVFAYDAKGDLIVHSELSRVYEEKIDADQLFKIPASYTRDSL